jgi:hypothetical protein
MIVALRDRESQRSEDSFMRETQLTLPELGLIAATRGILGAGVGLLLADHLPDSVRKPVGWTLLSLGALSTIPLALTVFGRSHRCEANTEKRMQPGHQPQRESNDRIREPAGAAGI